MLRPKERVPSGIAAIRHPALIANLSSCSNQNQTRKTTRMRSVRMVLVALAISAIGADAALAEDVYKPPSNGQTRPGVTFGLPPLPNESLARILFKRAAYDAVKIQRFVNIGVICRKLSEADSATISKNARAEMQDIYVTLPAQDQEWANTWVSGLSVGAMSIVDLTEYFQDPAACEKFAKPDGPLSRIMTWTDKPQVQGGILASPRTMP
jgi:hypothetical protein